MSGIMEVIRTIRHLRSEMNVNAGRRTRLMLLPRAGWEEALAHAEPYFKRLAGASELTLITDAAQVTEKTVSAVTATGTLYIPLGDLVDFDREIARLEKELKGLNNEIARSGGMLNNPGFLGKAPASLVEAEKAKLATAQAKAADVLKRLEELREAR